jgi:hypothetical protein
VTVTVSDGVNPPTTHEWTITQTSYPIADNFNGNTTDFEHVDVTSINPLVLERAGYGKIVIQGPIDLSDVTIIDGLVRIERGLIAVDTDALPMLAGKQANVTLVGLNYAATPAIFYNAGFTVVPAEITGTCTASTDPACSVISSTPAPTTNGQVTFSISHLTSFKVMSNANPIITSTAITSAYIDEAYSYNTDATDADGDPITYSLTTSPAGMAIDASTGIITWTPNATGNYNVVVSAHDDKGGSTTQSYTLSVSERPKLSIKKIDVIVAGNKDKNLDNGNTIGEDAKPGDKLVFDIEVCNDYTRDEGTKIRNVQATATIEEIDDGDDIDADSQEVDIKADDCQTLKVELDVPPIADEDTYNVVVDVEGDSDNFVTWNLALDVSRDKHHIYIANADLTPSTLSCESMSSLSVRLYNVGTEDEDQVAIKAENSELGIFVEEKGIQLDATSDSDAEYSKTFNLNVPAGTFAGDYPITITSYYDTSKQSETKTATLSIIECTRQAYVPATTPITQPTLPMTTPTYATGVTTPVEGAYGDTELQILGPGTLTTAYAATPYAYATEQVSFTDTDEYVLLLIVGVVIVLGIIGYFVGYLMLRRR